MQSSGTRNSSDGRVIRRRIGIIVVLGLIALELVAAAIWGANQTTESGQAALGGVGLLLVSAGSVVLVRGR